MYIFNEATLDELEKKHYISKYFKKNMKFPLHDLKYILQY